MPLRVAIVGRPNVGKSTLFNRLAGKKLALVDDRPGVTRDRKYASGRIGDIDLTLIDTAGFEDVTDESLESRMRAQTEKAVDEAELVLFVIDGREGVVPLDRIFADLLRKRDKPVAMLVNKAEGRAADHGIGEAHALGFGEPIAISAEHGEGLADLYAEIAKYAPEPEIEEEAFFGADGEDEEEEEAIDPSKPIMIAIVGRPNAGKSTLVNRLIGEDRLLTGPEAGITRDSISVDWMFNDRPIRLVDTAGMRRKARVQEKLEKLSVSDSIRAITFAEVVVLVMDEQHAFDTQDLQLADLVEREGRALIYVIAKWDLVEEPQARLKELQMLADEKLPQLRGSPLVALSGETGRGVDRLMPAVLKAHRNWSTKVKTRDLNDWLAMAVQRHPPPAVDGRRLKPKYMAQIKARPPTFVLFANRASQMPEQYRRYLINSLRESFDLPGVPLRVNIKSGANPYAEGGERAGPSKTAPRGLKAKARSKAHGKPKPGAKAAVEARKQAKPGKALGPRGQAVVRPRSGPGAKPKSPLKTGGQVGARTGAKPGGKPGGRAPGSRPGPRPTGRR